MAVGGYLSAAAHAGIVSWLIWYGDFNGKPLELPATEVSIVTSEQFDILANANQPEVEDLAEQIAPPLEESAPSFSATQDAAPEVQTSEAQAELERDPLPERIPEAIARPEEVVIIPPTELQAPQVIPDETLPSVASLRPTPRPAPRVAPTAVAPPPPDLDIGDIQRDEVGPEESPDPQPEEQPAQAPEEAATEIVTEAETPNSAPTRSLRPQARPSRPAETAVATNEATSDPTSESDPVADALAEALAAALEGNSAGSSDATTPSPAEERQLAIAAVQGMQLAISECWRLGAMSTEVLSTVVKVGMELTPDGRPIESSFYLATQSGGTPESGQLAYQNARRAIIECGARGYELPKAQYDLWRYVEMTFNPELMRGR